MVSQMVLGHWRVSTSILGCSVVLAMRTGVSAVTGHLLWVSVAVPHSMVVHERVWVDIPLLSAIDKDLLRWLLSYVSRTLLESLQHVTQHMSHQCWGGLLGSLFVTFYSYFLRNSSTVTYSKPTLFLTHSFHPAESQKPPKIISLNYYLCHVITYFHPFTAQPTSGLLFAMLVVNCVGRGLSLQPLFILHQPQHIFWCWALHWQWHPSKNPTTIC